MTNLTDQEKWIKAEQNFLRSNPKELAKRVLDTIKNEPDKWDQDFWGKFNSQQVRKIDRFVVSASCPTTACVAGWTTTISGYPMATVPWPDEDWKVDGINITTASCFEENNPNLLDICETAEKLMRRIFCFA